MEIISSNTGAENLAANGTEAEPKKVIDSSEMLENLPPSGDALSPTTSVTIANSKPPPKFSRNYVCEECSFRTRKSRAFLYHLVEEHKSKLDIFACSHCDYCAQSKFKMQRHIKMNHGIALRFDELKAEHSYVRTKKVSAVQSKSVPMKRIKRVRSSFITKSVPGKKLTVKFMKPQGSGSTLPAPKQHSSYLPSPTKSQSMEHLSKVVDEIPAENGGFVYKCKECQFTSDDKQKVAKHAVSWHVDTKSFACTYCDYITFDRNDFGAHRQVHRNEHQFRCDECTYSTDFRPNMDRHILNHTNSFPFTCSFCTYGCNTEAAIRRHMVNNHDPVPQAEKKTSLPVPKTVRSLQKSEVSTVLGTDSVKVTDTEEDDKIDEHEDMEIDMVDGSVEMTSSNKTPEFDDGQTGTQNTGQGKIRNTVTHFLEKDNGKLLCPVCKLKYKRSSDLNRHMKRKHGCRLREYVEVHFNVKFPPLESAKPSRPTQHVPLSMVNSRGEVGFSTEYLDYGNDDFLDIDDTFDDLDQSQEISTETAGPLDMSNPLDLSVKSGEDESPISPEKLKCPHCPYQAKWPSDYRRHIVVHSLERRYKCTYCPKKYKYLGDLNVHVRKDHKKEPGNVKVVKVPAIQKKMAPALFKCPCCNYTSCWKSEVDRHSRLHTDEKSFQCKQCEYQSYWRGDMRRHMYKRHPEVMTEGVALNDVIIVNKNRAKIVAATNSKELKSTEHAESTSGVEMVSEASEKGIINLVEEQTVLPPQLVRDSSLPPYGMLQSGLDISGPNNLPSQQSTENTPPGKALDITPPQIAAPGFFPFVLTGTPKAQVSKVSPSRTPTSKSPTPSPIKDLGGGMYECNYCGFTANAPSKMNMHIATHTNLKRYKCPTCGRRANWKWDISKHIKRDHNDFFTQVIKLSKEEAENTIQEYMEGYPTVRRDHHLNVTPEKTIPHLEGIKFFKCSVCDFSAEKKLSVSRHISYMHNATVAKIIVIKKMPQDSSPQITPLKLSPQITQSTPQSSPGLDFGASPIVTPVPKTTAPMPSVKPIIPPPPPLQPLPPPEAPAHITDGTDIDKPFMCSDCGKRGVTKGDVKKHYHYVHPNQEIRIVYLGDGSQSVYAAKSEIGQFTPEKSSLSSSTLETSQTDSSASPDSKDSPSINSSSTGIGRPISSTLPHPKVLGYIRPYKCSLCGRRSNWKWDLNNHLRDKHRAEDGARVITLNENEAKATLEHYMKFELPVLLGTAIKGEVLKTVKETGYTVKVETVEPPPPSKGSFRQLKCSACPYRANLKADLSRHIVRKHGATRAKIIVLDTETARRTLPSYSYSRFPKKASEHSFKDVVIKETTSQDSALSYSSSAEMTVIKSPSSPSKSPGKHYWKCSVCSYTKGDKVDVLKHMGKHNMKAYKCSACDYNSNFRSGVYRHIKFKHNGDKTVVGRLTIKLIKEGTEEDVIATQTMPEDPQEIAIPASPSLASLPLPLTPQKDNNFPAICEKFYCKLCMFQSRWRSCVCRHLRDKHKIHDYINFILKRVIDYTGLASPQKTSSQAMMSPQRLVPAVGAETQLSSSPKSLHQSKPRNFLCSLCPYRTYKSKMLKFHMTCHKPQPGVKQAKCKYCPYYVSGSRLLSQHMQLHMQHPDGPFVHPTTPVKASPQKVPKSPDVSKRHGCEKCPYTTNSKNDFLYHKQFHRPKPTADFKCDHCEYWVTHKRLLKQHAKVHTGEFYSSNMSNVSSPAKSDYSENALVYDTVEIAAIKQRIIASKITPSISVTPAVSPMKLASNCTMGNKRGFLKKDGTYRKIHKCRFCPYLNLRTRNLRLHELMHGRRSSTNTLMKCPHCNYYVGSKGLLAHHLKVHQPDYGLELAPSADSSVEKPSDASEDSEMDQPIAIENKVDTLYEIAKFKKFGCEKCPYASAKRSHFQRHVELHGSKQKCKCDFCDYSVPSMNLLCQHTKLHFEPNQNLLAAQSILNLQYLPEMPADVALSSMMTNVDSKHPVSVTHDHLELYENAPEECEPKKLYRCDRCPYANIRRDHLLAHLRCHMVKNEFVCPYCDYSVGKTHVLLQHVKVHFSPLPELSDWLVQSGDTERIKQSKERNIKEAIELATLFQTERKAEKKEKETAETAESSDKEASKSSAKTDGIEHEKKETPDKLEKEVDGEDNKLGEEVKMNKSAADQDESQMDTSEQSFATVEVDQEISFKVIEKDVVKAENVKEKDVDVEGEMNKEEDKDTAKMETADVLKEDHIETTNNAVTDSDKGENMLGMCITAKPVGRDHSKRIPKIVFQD